MVMGRRTRCLLAGAVLGWASAALAQTIPSAIQSVTVTPQTGSFYTSNVLVPVEDNYLPNVVWRENGGASYQALKVQAVAARGYMYYKLSQTPNGGKATSIRDGTSDQVYSKSPTAPFMRSTATGSQLNDLRAADESEREILITSSGEPVCTFFVAGGKPDTSSDTNTIWPNGAPLGKWEMGDLLPTDTEKWVTYNRGLTGASVQPTPLGSITNPVNRGAMSQNGSSFLGAGRTSTTNPERNFAAWDYVDILKYYYGQDTQLALAKVPATGELPAFVKQIASFDYDEGYLRNRMDFSTTNTTNISYGTSSHARDTTAAQSGAASQKIVVDIFAGTTQAFTYRHMSGMAMGTEANPTINDNLIGTKTANLLIENRGSFGFWIKTTNANLSARPLLDDGATSTEQGVARNVVPDGQWHKYEWYLTDNAEWTSFSGGNNAISGNWTLDSILFNGSGHTTLNLDTVFYDAGTTPPVNQWVYDGNGTWGVAGNWVNAAPDNLNAVANFLGKTSGHRVVTISSPVSVGTINFNQPLGYELFNNSITFVGLTLDVSSGSAAINVQSFGTQTISSGLNIRDNANIDVVAGGTLLLSGVFNVGAVGVGKTITKTGAGTLTIDGPQTHQPGTVIAATGGVINLNSNSGTNASLSISGNGSSIVLGADQDVGDVSIAFGDGGIQSLDLNSPTTAGAFRTLRVHSGDNAGPTKTSLYAAIVNGAIHAGDGVVDSGQAAHPGSAIGIAIVSDYVLVRSTRIGDLNLDGSVTISDFIDLASHFNGNGTWQEGDLNYDGSVTISDFIDLASNFNTDYAGEVWPISAADQATLNAFTAANVPEPGAILSMIGVGMALLKRTRARRPWYV